MKTKTFAAPTLSPRQRLARATAGAVFVTAALRLWHRPKLWLPAAGSLWFGLSHLAAAATGYSGCPELGAIPTLILRRDVKTVCHPWHWIDSQLGRSPVTSPVPVGFQGG